MALLVSDSRTESFEKPPPPKKKWIQNYLEKDCKQHQSQLDTNAYTRGVVQNVIDQVQDYIDERNKKSISNGISASEEEYQSKKMASLLNPANNGTKFNNSLKSLAEHQDQPSLTKQDIGGVVQGVISQFLNGNLSDAGFRRSRRRCSKHENCSGRNSRNKEHKDRKRRRDVLVMSPDSAVTGEPVKGEGFEEEGLVLNLSLPKAAKVSFAAEDRCYSMNSSKTFVTSKSQEMHDVDVARASQMEAYQRDSPLDFSGQSISPAVSSPMSSSLAGNFSQATEEGFRRSQAHVPVLHPPPASPSAPINLVLGELSSPGVLRTHSSFSVIQPRIKEPVIPAVEEAAQSLPSLASRIRLAQPAAHVYDSRISSSVSPSLDAGQLPVLTSIRSPASSSQPCGRRSGVLQPAYGKLLSPKKDGTKKESVVAFKGKEKTDSGLKDECKKSNSNREMHNRLEKNRRAHLKQCFDELAKECELDPKKASNLTVIRSAYKYIMAMRRKERENEKELAKLVQEKIRRKERLEELRREVPGASHLEDN